VVRALEDADVLEAIGWAREHHLPVRAFGAGHSYSPLVPTGGVLVDMRDLTGITGVDSTSGRIRARGGTTLADLDEALWDAGHALPVLGDYDKQTVAGAVATGTHGSCPVYGNLSSLVTWVRLATAGGEVIEIDTSDLRLLRAARVALGLLGVVLEVELQTRPALFLRTDRELVDPGALDWAALPNSARHVSFHYLPGEGSAGLSDLVLPDGADASGAGRALVKRLDGADEGTDGAERAYRAFTRDKVKPFHEAEFFVPTARAPEAFAGMVELLTTRFPEQQYPLEVRFVAGDDSWLSPSQGGDRVALSLVMKANSDYWNYLTAADEFLAGYDARPHWGKLHLLTRDRVADLYPHLADFQEVRTGLDPQGLFLNDHLRALLG
jgi:FAD/FMN-containing dehydrogenase